MLGLIGTPKDYQDVFHELMSVKDGELFTDGRISSRNFYSKCFPAILDEKKKTESVKPA